MKPSVAVLYQAKPAPAVNGIAKPMKPGGYRDSGADIAFALQSRGIKVITRRDHPRPPEDLDWVFADSIEGVRAAKDAGADTLWLNTVLSAGHPAEKSGLRLVGQPAALAERFDDKLLTNEILRKAGLPAADSRRFAAAGLSAFPFVLKPIRGRGSHAVSRIGSEEELVAYLAAHGHDGLMEEPWLGGEEITLTVLPAGDYPGGARPRPWCLPPVRRLRHEGGIAPFNGRVPVAENSEVLSVLERAAAPVRAACAAAEEAAALVGIRAPIRIDARADASGKYYLFDLNMKPNLTGPGRPGRERQDSLVSLAAKAYGWPYAELLEILLRQAWRP
jgi:D-alanine-D-alanine ligase